MGFTARKPWHVAQIDANYFKSAMGGNHEFKFGFGYRRNPNKTTTTWSGSQVVGFRQSETDYFAWVTRQRSVAFKGQYWNAYVGDTFTKGRFTLSAGVRWDRQTSKNSPSTATANPAFPEVLPALSFDGNSQDIAWNDVSPRVSATYALDESRKTVARASYSRYAGQLNPFEVTYASPVGGYYTFVAFRWVDANGDRLAQKGELLTGEGVQYANNVDPDNPTSATAINRVDPNYKANHDQEFIIGIDRELAPNFALSAAYTWRKATDLQGWSPRVGLTRGDYTQNDSASQNGFSAVSFAANPEKVGNGARQLSNRTDFFTRYNGFEVSAVKRLSNKWFARAAFAFMDWTEHFDGTAGIQNPTRSDTSGGDFSGPGDEGGQVAPRSYGAKANTFFNSKWQFSANGLYQLPAGFEIAASLFGRQGYPLNVILNLDAGDDGTIRTLGEKIGDSRYDNLWNLDFRLAKTQKIAGNVNLNITLDLFNAFNNNVVLVTSRVANSDAFGRTNEVISPRILRIGVRLQF